MELSPNISIKVTQTLRGLGADCVCTEGVTVCICETSQRVKLRMKSEKGIIFKKSVITQDFYSSVRGH